MNTATKTAARTGQRAVLKKAGRTGQYVALAMYIIFLAAPLAWIISVSFKSNSELYLLVQSWIPKSASLDNYRAVIQETTLLRSVLNSVIVSGLSAALTVILALPAAYLMARSRGKATKAMTGWVLASQMFPFILIIVPLYIIMIQVGLYDSYAALVLVYTVWTLPFAIWMLRNYISAIPIELEQAAALDRASGLQVLMRVIGPLAVPGIIVAFLFAFIQAWNEFLFALILLKNPDLATLSLMLVRFIGSDGAVRIGPLAAASIMSAIPNLILFGFLQRRLVHGLLGGSVRG